MAANDEGDERSEDAPEGKTGSKKKLIIMIVLGLSMIGLSVGGTLFAVKMFGPPAATGETEAEVEAEPLPKPAIYFPLTPAIVVDYSVKGRRRFLQAELTMLTRDEGVVSAIELHQPMIRNSLVLLIGGQIFSELQTAEGKELLRQQCLQEVQRLLEQEIDKPGIEQVLFTSLVIQ